MPDLREAWSYINPFILRTAHGLQRRLREALAAREPKAVELFEQMEEVKEKAAKFMKLRAAWQFFEAESEGERLQLFEPGGMSPLHAWNFKRQKAGDQLCLSDYVLPARDGKRDQVAIFVVTGRGRAGPVGSSEECGYFRSHALQALAIESGEACAEWRHRRIREDWEIGCS